MRNFPDQPTTGAIVPPMVYVTEKTIWEYIENQNWDEDEEGFKITAHRALSRGCLMRLQPYRLSVIIQPTGFQPVVV